jgi:hypothetical protein
LVVLLDVELPVLVEVAVGDDRSQEQDGFGAGQAPAGAGDVESIFQVAAGAFDDARRGGQPRARAMW